jgi:UDP-2-acetamido-3-amino-2,3-dideoxy-glucuronate N-acetyltransferase
VLKDVPDYALVAGNPGRIVGWMCACGSRIKFGSDDGPGRCVECRKGYVKTGQRVAPQ